MSVLMGCLVEVSSGDTDDAADTNPTTSSTGGETTSSAPNDTGDSGEEVDGSGTETGLATSTGDASTTGGETAPLQLLEDGPHLGMIVGFEAPAPGTEAAVDALWNEALRAGMDVARVQVDWADLEPEPGVYALDDLEQALIGYEEQGLQIMVTLSTVDSLEFTLPPDLEDPEEPFGLADGLAFDDPAITERFAGLLDVVVPMVVQRGGFMITVGNEGDNAFGDIPELAPQIAGFTAAAKDHASSIDPALEISQTLTFASASTLVDVSAPIVDAVDVVTFNLYCDNEDGAPITEETIRARVRAVLDAAGDKPVVIQELGCAAGYDEGSVLMTSPETQRLFFEIFGQAMRDEPRLRAAYIFQLLDWSPSLAQLFADELEASGFGPEVVTFFTESLSTLGLCRWEDATCRPAWDQVLEELAAL